MIPHYIPYTLLALCYMAISILTFVDASLSESHENFYSPKEDDSKTTTVNNTKHSIEIADGVLYIIISIAYAFLCFISLSSEQKSKKNCQKDFL